ncbi:hypothetical protein [Bacillus toyonensis]|uniref:hypothetical protein n=1 Tax=Bacillus toyonensis TaxID=155322 RepID=UPI003F65B4E2
MYDSITKKLKSITDASGKVFTFTYTGEYVSKITGPSVGTDPREVTFEYDGNDLVASTTPEKKKYRYGYENGKLRYTYDPKHTEAKPYKPTYTYEGEKLVKVTDPLRKETVTAYNDEVREVTVTDQKGVKDIYSYTVAGNPLKTFVDADGLKLITLLSIKQIVSRRKQIRKIKGNEFLNLIRMMEKETSHPLRIH